MMTETENKQLQLVVGEQRWDGPGPPLPCIVPSACTRVGRFCCSCNGEGVCFNPGIERVCLLVHTKRGMKSLNYELVDLMERSKTPYQIVLTKTDLVFPIDASHRAMEIQGSLKKKKNHIYSHFTELEEEKKSVVNPVMMVSSKMGAGVCNLRGVLGRKLARFIKP